MLSWSLYGDRGKELWHQGSITRDQFIAAHHLGYKQMTLPPLSDFLCIRILRDAKNSKTTSTSFFVAVNHDLTTSFYRLK